MTILKLVSDTSRKPYAIVKASDEADAEIFAQNNAHIQDYYFYGMTAGAATETTEEGVFHVPFN